MRLRAQFINLPAVTELIFRFIVQHFAVNKTSPFDTSSSDDTPKKKSKKSNDVSDLQMVEACLRFLKLDLSFFRRAWNWDEFIEIYQNRGCDVQKFHCNQVLALLFGMNSTQLSKLNENVPKDVRVLSEAKPPMGSVEGANEDDGDAFEWNFKFNVITCIEGVFLPIFDKSNFQFYNNFPDKFDQIIHVDSTSINLRSLALGISSGKAICLSGPVGCGKTTLVEHLARKTGRLAPKVNEFMQFMQKPEVKGSKRKLRHREEVCESIRKVTPKNGFLRIQLGDQTDSKVLLGQYRCTDVPGEFLWQPGVLTQAVLNGYWLLLEDLDSATQDVCTTLTNLLENNFLSVPGFRENLKIAPGFQLFVTLR